MIAIRIQGLSRYVGAPMEMDGAARPREAFRALLRIAGLNVKPSDEELQSTVAGPGYVLRNVSLDIEQGSVVCLTGASGSGPSALLEVLAGAVPPTAGRVQIFDPVNSLLSMNADVDMQSSAYDNIQASRAFAEGSPEDAAAYVAEVLEFAELHGFEHALVRTFSTGMVLRLSVALALCGRPAIVLIDDVLRVGDIAFQQKCVERVMALKAAGSTLVLAFTDEALVQQLATRVVTFAGGRVIGDTAERNPTPREQAGTGEITWQVLDNLPEDDIVALQSIAIDATRHGDETFLELHLMLAPKADDLRCRPLVSVVTETGVLLYRSVFPEFVSARRSAPLAFTVEIPTGILPTGRYTLALAVATRQNSRIFATKANEAVLLTIRRDVVRPEDDDVPLLQPALVWDTAAVTEAGASA